MSCEIVLAALLIFEPAGTETLEERVELLQPTLRAIAISAQLIDARERTTLTLALLRERAVSLRDAPRLEDGMWLPTGEHLKGLLQSNRDYREALRTRLLFDSIHADEIEDALAETACCYRLYDFLREAEFDYYYVSVRREALRSARDLIGAEAFYSGALPAHLPLRHIPIGR